MNPKSNHVNESNCVNNNKEQVNQITCRKELLLASIHSRDYIFLRDSLLELVTQVTIVTLSTQISSSGNYLTVFNIDFPGSVISLCFEARCKFTVFSYTILKWNYSQETEITVRGDKGRQTIAGRKLKKTKE